MIKQGLVMMQWVFFCNFVPAFIHLSKSNLIKTNQAYELQFGKSPALDSKRALFLPRQSVAKSYYWRFITNPLAPVKYNKIYKKYIP